MSKHIDAGLQVPPTAREVLALLRSRPGTPFTESELAGSFGLEGDKNLYELATVLEDLIESDQIIYTEDNGGQFSIAEQGLQNGDQTNDRVDAAFANPKFALKPKSATENTLPAESALEPARAIGGTIEAEALLDYVSPRKAFGVIDGLADDLILDTARLQSGQNGDRIRVKYKPAPAGTQAKGIVLEVLERARTEFVGTLRFVGRRPMITSDMKRVHDEIAVEPDQLLQAAEGDKVVVSITNWGQQTGQMIGRVVEVLGKAGTHQAEMRGILAEFGLPLAFPVEVEAEAAKIKPGITKTEVARRRDMRPITTFTIDPIDAKDFDDAISLEGLEGGNYRVGIHIADVTHYVKEGTALEAEAINRATSVYLVDRVVPMLPEKLSNELCSLRPNEDKLTFSAIFDLDAKGTVLERWFGRSVIHSDRRFSYEQVQEVIEGAGGDYKDDLLTLNALAHALRDERFAHGAVSFETPELKFVLDEAGKPIKVVAKVRKDAHKLVEDFMLLANKHVAEYVYALTHGQAEAPTAKPVGKKKAIAEPAVAVQRLNGPMVYRIHEAPDERKIEDLAAFAARFGHKLNLAATKNLPKALNALAIEVENLPEGPVIGQYAIRSMQKARYTTDPLGHFGLGYRHYSHFTSPIRRYPDMMAHRLLADYLSGQATPDKATLEKLCKQSTIQEKRAADAERASVKYKQVEFMQERIGEEFAGIVSGLTEWGLYVEITDTACEGMVRLADLRDDHYDYDQERMTITGRRTGRRFQFGDSVRIRVKDANLLKRTLDLELADQPASTSHSSHADRSSDRGNRSQRSAPSSNGRGRSQPTKSGGGKRKKSW